MSDLTNNPHDPAERRYVLLLAALGEEPVSGLHRAVLARLAAWTSNDDLDGLAYLIRYAVGRAGQRHSSVLRELAELLGEQTPPTAGAGQAFHLPVGLVRRLLAAAETTSVEASPAPLPAVQRIAIDLGLSRGPDCFAWCAGVLDPHEPRQCFAERSVVETTLDRRPSGEGEIIVSVEAVDTLTPGIGILIGPSQADHRLLTVDESRQLAASLLDAADAAGGAR